MFGGSFSYVWRLYFYVCGLAFLRLGVWNSYVWGFVFLRLGVGDFYVWGFVFLRLEVIFLCFRVSIFTFGG